MIALPTYAQVDDLTSVGEASGLGTEDIRLVIAKIIRTFLTVLGVIAVIIVLYGGYTYMTAGGEEEKVDKAKKILINGGIGLTIIIFSWAITSFIISALMGDSGDASYSTSSSRGGGSGLGGGSVTSFAVAGIRPEGEVSIRNVQVSVTFSRALDTTTVDGNLVVTNNSTGESIEGTVKASGSRATFTPIEVCPSPHESRYCFDSNTEFTVTLDEDILSSAGTALSCTTGCTSSFTTGELIDTDDPLANLSAPDAGDRITVDSSTGVQAQGTDDTEVATADFSIDGATAFDSISSSGTDLSDVLFESTWYTDGLLEGTKYKVEVLVTDIAGNTDSDSVSVRATSASCSDDLLNGDETTVDAGGSCGAAEGESCTESSECASGLDCVDSVCTETPEIKDISPPSGAIGTFVTVTGTGFGSGTGTIEFTSTDGLSTIEAEIPSCAEGWSDTEVIVEVPETAGDGPIILTTSNDLVDLTSDDNGSLIPDFDVNTVEHPNLCRLSPSSAYISRAVTLTGTNFGASQEDSIVYFEATEAGSYTSWSDTSLKVTSPSVSAGDYAVNITVDGVTSNSVNFTTLSAESSSPTITYVSPEDGGIGQYVTIAGSGFGGSTGSVYFDNQSSGYRALGSDDFPDACSDSFWSDSEITIIVPESYTNSLDVDTTTHDVMVVTRAGEDSNTAEFTISTAEPTAGICLLDPDSGLPGDEVTIYGEHLGSDLGSIAFYNEAGATVSTDGWDDSSVVVTVPTLAQTGALSLTTSSSEEANTLNFEITSDSTDDTATPIGAAYGWRFSTGEIPETPKLYTECSDTRISAVPNNQFTSGGVCTNAMVFGEFNMTMQEASFIDGDSVLVEECSDNSCVSGSVAVVGSITISHSTGSDGSGQSSFSWRPISSYNGGDFKTSTTYQVTLSTDISASAGLSLAEAETWKFTTSATSQPCEVQEVRVSPSSDTITADDQTSEFLALPSYGCVVLDSATYSWTWDVDDSYASINEGDCEDSTGDDCAVAVPLAQGVTDVTATEDASEVSGNGVLTIDYTDPYVLNYWPSCDEACINAQIGASFNIKMEPSSIQASGAAQLYSCANELCVDLASVADSASCLDQTNCDSIYFSTGDLVTDTFYRIVISGDVVSTSGVPLTRSNYGADYSWVFSTKDSSEECAVSRATIEPDDVTLEAIGQSQSFVGSAFGVQDDCSTSGQRLNSYSYDWTWEDPIVDDTDVAYWFTTSSTLLDSDPDDITAGCTAGCISGGSSTYYAVCGDGTVGIGEDCDDKNTTSGDGCSSTCLAEGTSECSKVCSASGTSCSTYSDCPEAETCDFTGTNCCGNGLMEDTTDGGGEECDDSNADDADGCSSACTNEGAKEVGATCGNSSIGFSESTGGEDCDDGDRTSGNGCSSLCLNEGSSALGDVDASCGDGVIDAPYESCDDSNNYDLDGCSSICLREGAGGIYADFGSTGKCGDGVADRNATTSAGEDCDSATDEGCGSDCLWLGSSTDYSVPSVCGDGAVGIGEISACEASAGDGYIDPLQLSVIDDDAGFQVDTDTHLATTTIRTQVEQVTAEASLSLSCVADLDEDCPDIGTKQYGVADNSCCMERPSADLFPNGTDTCRNAALYGIFTSQMDVSSFGSDDNSNFYIELDPTTTDSGSCPEDYDTVAVIGVPESFGLFARLWQSIVSFFVVDEAEAQATSSGTCDAGENAGDVCSADEDCKGDLVSGATCSLGGDCSLVVCNGDPAGSDAVESSLYNGQQCKIDCDDTLTCAEGDADSDGYCDGTTSVGSGLLCGSGTVDCTDTYYCDGVSKSGTSEGTGYESCVSAFSTAITGCFLPVTSVTQTALSDGTYKVYFNYSTELESDATYTIHVDGDTIGDAVFEGVTSQYGVTMDGDTEQDFTTGSAICTLDEIDVEDSDSDSPNVFSLADETHIINASTYSFTSGSREEVVSLPGVYAWTWLDWLEDSDETIFEVATSDDSKATISAVGIDGQGTVVAQAEITDFPDGEIGDVVSGSTEITAFICEVPWPNPDTQSFPFVDDATNTITGAAIGVGWMNFSTYYCRDAGEDGTSDDYKSVTVVPSTPASASILKEYFFIYDDNSGDAIGVRIATNEDYLNPSAWYTQQGFAGDPTLEEYDGFEALRDGRTVYIAGPNLSGTTLYPNMYVISYNEGASESLIDVFDQVVKHMALATNADDINLCWTGSAYTNEVCSSDVDCDVTGEICGSVKDKIARDTQRLTDVKEIETELTSYGLASRLCSETTDRTCDTSSDCPDGESCDQSVPTLEAGSYVRALSTSAWPSWSGALTDALESDSLPTDPLNFYNGCGASPYASYDSETCVNQTVGEYLCPADSYVYHYRSVGPFDYELSAELEYNSASWAYDIDSDTKDGYVVIVGGDLSATSDGFSTLSAYCDATSYGGSTTCGDGLVGSGETCESGDTSSTTCDSDALVDANSDGTLTNDADGYIRTVCKSDCTGYETSTTATCEPASCGNGTVETGEDCDDGDSNGVYGYCGNDCTWDTAFYCGDGSVAGGEVCDCGTSTVSGRAYGSGACSVLNGVYSASQYDSCSSECDSAGPYCGDSDVTGSEECDGNTDEYSGLLCIEGDNVGQQCESYYDCGERIDGSGLYYSCGQTGTISGYAWADECPISSVCIAGDTDLMGTACDSDSDCNGSDSDGECSISTYQTTRVNTCADDGSAGDSCTWNESTWQNITCTAEADCGNGTVEGAEECDDGNTDSTDDCTNACTVAYCGDGYVQADIDNCDEGTENGVMCDSAYGSACTYCTTSCNYAVTTGTFCGDGVINGDEYCDASDLPYYYYDATAKAIGSTCITLGETSGDFTCTAEIGICNGGENGGEYCSVSSECGTGYECAITACNDSCTATCPATLSSESILIKSNQLSISRASSATLYSSTDKATVITANAATLYIPACNSVSTLSLDIDDTSREYPDIDVMFVIDGSLSMDETLAGESKLSVLERSVINTATTLFDAYSETWSKMSIGYVVFYGRHGSDLDGDGLVSYDDGEFTNFVHLGTGGGSSTKDELFTNLADFTTSLQSTLGGLSATRESGTPILAGILEADNQLVTYPSSAEANRYMIIFTDGNILNPDYSTLAEYSTLMVETEDDASTFADEDDGNAVIDSTEYFAGITAMTDLISTTRETEIFTAVLSDTDCEESQMQQWSSMECSDSGRSNCINRTIEGNVTCENPDNGITYAYSATTAEGLSEMYEQIADSIVNFNFSLTFDGDTAYTAIPSGDDSILNLPETFVCDGSNEQPIEVSVSWNGGGTIGLADVSTNACVP